MVEIWKTLGILTAKQYDDIQLKVDSYVCPADIGRVPSKLPLHFLDLRQSSGRTGLRFFHSLL